MRGTVSPWRRPWGRTWYLSFLHGEGQREKGPLTSTPTALSSRLGDEKPVLLILVLFFLTALFDDCIGRLCEERRTLVLGLHFCLDNCRFGVLCACYSFASVRDVPYHGNSECRHAALGSTDHAVDKSLTCVRGEGLILLSSFIDTHRQSNSPPSHHPFRRKEKGQRNLSGLSTFLVDSRFKFSVS